MLGTEDKPGNMMLTLDELFSKISLLEKERDITVKLWYLEIYNELLKDLLNPSSEDIELREDPIKGTTVNNIFELQVTSLNEVMKHLRFNDNEE